MERGQEDRDQGFVQHDMVHREVPVFELICGFCDFLWLGKMERCVRVLVGFQVLFHYR